MLLAFLGLQMPRKSASMLVAAHVANVLSRLWLNTFSSLSNRFAHALRDPRQQLYSCQFWGFSPTHAERATMHYSEDGNKLNYIY